VMVPAGVPVTVPVTVEHQDKVYKLVEKRKFTKGLINRMEGKETIFKIKLPFTYLSINKILSMNWHERAKWVKKYKQDVGLFLNIQKIPRLRLTSALIKVDLYFKTNPRRDLGNYEPKFLTDALVDSGILKDDNSKILTKRTEVEIFYPSDEEKTEITIRGLYEKN